jgi:hypothetical protein
MRTVQRRNALQIAPACLLLIAESRRRELARQPS